MLASGRSQDAKTDVNLLISVRSRLLASWLRCSSLWTKSTHPSFSRRPRGPCVACACVFRSCFSASASYDCLRSCALSVSEVLTCLRVLDCSTSRGLWLKRPALSRVLATSLRLANGGDALDKYEVPMDSDRVVSLRQERHHQQ